MLLYMYVSPPSPSFDLLHDPLSYLSFSLTLFSLFSTPH